MDWPPSCWKKCIDPNREHPILNVSVAIHSVTSFFPEHARRQTTSKRATSSLGTGMMHPAIQKTHWETNNFLSLQTTRRQVATGTGKRIQPPSWEESSNSYKEAFSLRKPCSERNTLVQATFFTLKVRIPKLAAIRGTETQVKHREVSEL